MLATLQNNRGSGREHVQFKTVRRLNSRNWCNIGARPVYLTNSKMLGTRYLTLVQSGYVGIETWGALLDFLLN